MKKRPIIYLILVTFAMISFLIYSCAKKDSSMSTVSTLTVSPNLLQAAKDWHDQHTHLNTGLSIKVNNCILQPVWQNSKIITAINGNKFLIVASPTLNIDPASKLRGIRKFVFTIAGDKITDGKIIETAGNPNFITKHNNDLIENLIQNNTIGFTGYELLYDVNYRHIKSFVYQNGSKLFKTVTLRGDNGQEKALLDSGSSKNSISPNSASAAATGSSCFAYYLVTTDLTTGDETWEYLFTSCDSGGMGDAGGGGGGTNAPSADIFGIDGKTNSVISDDNFDQYLEYAASLGFSVGEPFETTLTYNGVTYTGQITEVRNSAGVVVAAYFSPDVNTTYFSVGYEYNMVGTVDQNDTYYYSVVFGNPYLGTGNVTYIGNGGTGATSNTTVDDEYNPNESNTDPNIAGWTSTTTTYPKQTLPTFAKVSANYPRNFEGGEMAPALVYSLVGGSVLTLYNSNPVAYGNACALRLSRALLYAGIKIPNVSGITFQGADGNYYFLSSSWMYDFMLKTFGAAAINLYNSDGGTGGSLFQSKLSGHQGIYIMQVNYPAQFGAMGHCDLFNGSTFVDKGYFGAKGGVEHIALWILK
jgi:hypothetical protein